MDENDEVNEETQGFVAKLNNYKILKQFFQAVNVNDGGTASFYLQSHGLKMTVEDCKTFQANAFLDQNIFNEFTYTPEQDLGFNLQLKSILDVLNIFGSAKDSNTTLGGTQSTIFSTSPLASLVLHCADLGEPFCMWLEEEGIVTKAELPTRDLEETLAFGEIWDFWA